MNPKTVRRLQHWLKKANPSVIFFIKTKLQSKQMELVHHSCGIDVATVGSNGGLSLGWKSNVSISLHSHLASHIDAIIDDDLEGNKWR